MEHLKEITQKPQMRPFIKKIHENVFKYVLLNCTMIRDVCKRTYLRSAFIQNLTHFWLVFLGLILDGEVQNCTPVITFDKDMLQSQKAANI